MLITFIYLFYKYYSNKICGSRAKHTHTGVWQSRRDFVRNLMECFFSSVLLRYTKVQQRTQNEMEKYLFKCNDKLPFYSYWKPEKSVHKLCDLWWWKIWLAPNKNTLFEKKKCSLHTQENDSLEFPLEFGQCRNVDALVTIVQILFIDIQVVSSSNLHTTTMPMIPMNEIWTLVTNASALTVTEFAPSPKEQMW